MDEISFDWNMPITVMDFCVIPFGSFKELEKEVADSISDVVIDPDNPEVPKSTELYEPHETCKEQSEKSFTYLQIISCYMFIIIFKSYG